MIAANIDSAAATDSLVVVDAPALGIDPAKQYGVFDVFERKYHPLAGEKVSDAWRELALPGDSVRLFYMREASNDRPQHVWGGKRIEERWDAANRRLSVRLSGPAGLSDAVFLTPGTESIRAVSVDGKPAKFAKSSDGTLLHGEVTFRGEPILLEVELGEGAELPVEDPAPQSPYEGGE